MNAAVAELHAKDMHAKSPRIALVGNPNCG